MAKSCRTCGAAKNSYPTMTAAIAVALKASAKTGTPLHPYRCRSGVWHLTSQHRHRATTRPDPAQEAS